MLEVRSVHDTRMGLPQELRHFLQWKSLHAGWFSMARELGEKSEQKEVGLSCHAFFPAFSLRLTITNTSQPKTHMLIDT